MANKTSGEIQIKDLDNWNLSIDSMLMHEDGTNEAAQAKIAEYVKILTVNYITSKVEEIESAKLKKAQEDFQTAVQSAENAADNIVII